MKIKAKPEDEIIGFSIAAMIDIVFLLLIFFIVASQMKEIDIEIEVALPVAADSAIRRNEGIEELFINVTDGESGVIKVGGRIISFNELAGELQRIASDDAEKKIVIRGDSNALHGRVMRLMRACAEANMWNVTFATYQEAED